MNDTHSFGHQQRLERMVIVGGPDVDARIDLMRALSVNFEVSALGSTDAIAGRFADAGFSYRTYPLARGVSPLGDVRTVATLRREIAALRPAVVHAFDTKPCVYARLAARSCGVPAVIGTLGGLGALYSEEARPLSRALKRLVRACYEPLQRWASRAADVTVLQNERDRRELVARGVVPAERTRVISGSGVRTDVFDPDAVAPDAALRFRRELGIPAGAIVATLVGRVIRSKGVLLFAEAAERLPEVEFLLLGGEDPESLDRLTSAEKERLRRAVRWPGARSDVREALAASDLLVLPTSYREGVPRVLLEAGAMALPLVATENDACRTVVQDGVTGILIPVGDVGALVAAIARLARDPALRRRLGTAARMSVVEHHDLRRVAQEYAQVYREVLARRGV